MRRYHSERPPRTLCKTVCLPFKRFSACIAVILTCAAFATGPRVISLQYEDLPPALSKQFARDPFPALLEAINHETAKRERDGEFDHLIAYALQSNQFTSELKIEPAQSAKEYVGSGTVPKAVERRFKRFLQACAKPGGNQRLIYFSELLDTQNRNLPFLEREYIRVMEFLYQKEFAGAKNAYETRGHSTDTQVAANYAVWNALAVIEASAPQARIRRALIVGPGLDFAPRTELVDVFPPQSFQPYALADALLGLYLARRSDLRIDCVDINARVIRYINSFPMSDRLLRLYSEPGVPDYNNYFNALGSAIGSMSTRKPGTGLPPGFLQRTLAVDPAVAGAIHATNLNILTERFDSTYDLIVATNILLYFDEKELSLALANISKMLSQGGYFIHNDLRPAVEANTDLLHMPTVQARTVLIAHGQHAPLYDSFSICRKQ